MLTSSDSCSTMLLISSVVRLITKAARQLGERVNESNSELTDRMVEGIDGMTVIRAFGQEVHEQHHFDLASNRLRRVMLRMAGPRAPRSGRGFGASPP